MNKERKVTRRAVQPMTERWGGDRNTVYEWMMRGRQQEKIETLLKERYETKNTNEQIMQNISQWSTHNSVE